MQPAHSRMTYQATRARMIASGAFCLLLTACISHSPLLNGVRTVEPSTTAAPTSSQATLPAATAVIVPTVTARLVQPSATAATQPSSMNGATRTPVPATATAAPTLTTPPPSPTPVPPTATTQPKAASTSTAVMAVKIYLVAVGDNGVTGKLVGCGDSAVPVQVMVPHSAGVLRASLDALLGQKSRVYGESGLYNALYQSSLALESLTLQGGKATIRLKGQLTLGGECDNPRVAAQIRETALQFTTVREVQVYLNGRTLESVLSLK